MTRDPQSYDVVVQPLSEAPRTDGRRGAYDYYDLGVAAATGGDIGAHYVVTYGPMKEATGWHYHGVEAQLLYIIRGWVDLEFEDGVRRLEAGTFALIPGGRRHNQVGKSEETEAIEIALGPMSTVPCDPPDGAAGPLSG